MSKAIICELHSCNKEVPEDRLRRRYVTCSAKCGRQNSLDKMVIRRAHRSGKKVLTCTKPGCGRLFTDYKGEENDWCNKCRGIHCGPKSNGKRKNYNYAANASGVGGTLEHDFRATICNRNGKLCVDYSKCSDSLGTHKKGAFKYQTNGGLDCYVDPGDTLIVPGKNSSSLYRNHLP